MAQPAELLHRENRRRSVEHDYDSPSRFLRLHGVKLSRQLCQVVVCPLDLSDPPRDDDPVVSHRRPRDDKFRLSGGTLCHQPRAVERVHRRRADLCLPLHQLIPVAALHRQIDMGLFPLGWGPLVYYRSLRREAGHLDSRPRDHLYGRWQVAQLFALHSIALRPQHKALLIQLCHGPQPSLLQLVPCHPAVIPNHQLLIIPERRFRRLVRRLTSGAPSCFPAKRFDLSVDA